jgi:hypothetical protein
MAFLAYFNTVLTYTSSTLGPIKAMYARAPAQVSTLSAHNFGTWTVISGTVRVVAAYNLSNPEVYGLAVFTFLAADVHWLAQLLFFRTVTWKSIRLSLVLDIFTPGIMAVGYVRGWYFE